MPENPFAKMLDSSLEYRKEKKTSSSKMSSDSDDTNPTTPESTTAIDEINIDIANLLNNHNTGLDGKTPIKANNSYVKLNLPQGGYMEPTSNQEKRELISRDFRSDTMTAPTEEMFEFMKNASIGDDVYGEDLVTSEFQEKIAQLTGKEAAAFCVSGTMTNQLAIRTWLTQPPHSVLCDSRAHIHNYEAGGIAFHSQATTIPVKPTNGHTLTLEDIEESIVLSDDIHYAPTKLVCLENTIRGLVQPIEEIRRISDYCHSHNVITHCDGARIWEAAAKTGLSLSELCEPFDSVSLCLSKGLGAPIGSILVGPREFIKKVRWFRKMFGGGIRQCGSIVAAADYCVIHNFPRLSETHRLARYLADGLSSLGVKITLPVETNHVFIDPSSVGITMDELCRRALEEKRIRLGARIIVHIQIDPSIIDQLIDLVKTMKEEISTVTNGDSHESIDYLQLNGKLAPHPNLLLQRPAATRTVGGGTPY